ncbi:DUF2550 domain-containing protein [Acidipropionibacterium jensenii]|uniref:DUF2550 domain-containing protein n=1 Tax=Acidipropionibacterium jensenii TaxID=1749 RepID=UPI000BC32C78|nr:DUF2550 domain-containing protein [Acidipropionibacterium jensenii]AZZ42227.1 DUF2550 domain-containing protein [Acidipropionibacterium jensenii]
MGPVHVSLQVALVSVIQLELMAAVLVVAILAMAMVWLLIRHQILLRRRGVFVCGLRTLGPDESAEARPGKWMLGLAQYCAGDFVWYRPINPCLSPSVALHRSSLEMAEHHRPTPGDQIPFMMSQEVITLVTASSGQRSRCQIVVDKGVLTGLMSWLEAAPPGEANHLTARSM